jgi:ribonucleotide monophosphatase NagD (HAD superfamily)
LLFDSITLGDDVDDYRAVDGFLFLAAALWTNGRQNLLAQALLDTPRAVIIANPDLVAPREYGLSLDPGYYGHALADVTGRMPVFLGKPFAPVFERVEAMLSPTQDRSRIVMVGDTLHTDILGGAAKGWRTALITDHGLFAGLDVRPFIQASKIVPDWQMGSI